MDNHNKTDYISWMILIGLLLLVVEITFFNKGLVFSILFASLFLYFGGKRLYSSIGKLIFGLGCISLFFTTINMIVFKFLIFAVIGYVLLYFYRSKKRPVLIEPIISQSEQLCNRTKLIKPQQMFENLIFGHQKTPEKNYEWHDITIQVGIGDTKIDLSNTVLPKGEAVIAIRNFIGNIQILVPYEVEINISHSLLIGTTIIFDQADEKLFNQTLIYRTENYDEAFRKIKIVTSLGIGRLEVKRI